MNTTSKALEYTTFIVFRDSELSSIFQKVLTHLYMPLVGPDSINIYTTLSTFLSSSSNESLPIGHLKLFQILRITKGQEFEEARRRLEAVGLIDVYENGQNYIYRLNQPLAPNDFFNDEILSNYLLQTVGEETYQSLLVEFLMHRFDLKDYNDITKSFDEVFKVDNKETISYSNELNSLITTKSGEQIKVKNLHFDYQYLTILLGTLDILNKEILENRDFYNIVNRLSFMYQLTTEEIKDAIIASTTPNGDVNFEALKKMCKNIYDKHPVKGVITKVTDSTGNDKLINYLEQASPTEIVKTMFKVGLASSEIEMFDRLLETTGISLGLLNVMIIYVLKDKQGEVPSYNYFDKIAKQWQRVGITSTAQAIDYINGRNITPVKRTRRNSKSVPDWCDDYVKSIENKKSSTISKQNDDDLKEINELFKFEEK